MSLIELLISLFIFSVIAIILSTALNTVVHNRLHIEYSTDELRVLQKTLMIMAQDMEQIVNRTGMQSDEGKFQGKEHQLSFHHLGAMSATDVKHETVEYVDYYLDADQLYRRTTLGSLELLAKVSGIEFYYYDKNNHIHRQWPSEKTKDEVLPRAIQMDLNLGKRGSLSQLYVIPYTY